MLSSHTVGFQRPDNSNLANLTPGLCSSSKYLVGLGCCLTLSHVGLEGILTVLYIKSFIKI